LDRDGDLDIVASTEENGVYAYRMDGTRLWARCIGGGNAEPTVADITGDGYPEVVFASDGGVVTAMSGKSGATLPGWPFDARVKYKLGSGSMPVGPAIGQLDGVGGPEIVVGARDSHDANNFANNSVLLLAPKSNGQVLWAKQDPEGNPLTYTHAIIVDAQNDGQTEVYWGDWNTMGHKPPWDPDLAWQVTGPGNFYRYAADGTLVWKRTLGTYWSNKDLAIGDVDGDGIQEVLANGPKNGHDGIWYLDSRTGAMDAFVDMYPWKVSRGPILADLWNTGTMQMVVPGRADNEQLADGAAILVFDTHAPYNSVYPHLPHPTLLPPIVEPQSTWASTFEIKSPNAWWQEVKVKPDTARTVTAVEISIKDDHWQPLTKSSWGAWTASYNTPAETKVEFRAVDASNQYSISQPFSWMDGTLSKRSVDSSTPPPPPPPTTSTSAPPPPPTTTSTTPTTIPPPSGFDARFTVSPNVNEWWIEVTVSGNQQISNVDTRVNNGAWRPLTLRSWGSWAESYNAPKGSIVEFRATSSTGAQDLSERYCWMTTCDPSPPPTTTSPPSTFDANFFPKEVGNDWWVEVDVTANGHTISSVEAQVNGGTWRILDKQSWGSWAKSFNVPNGSEITFRATNGAGATDLSSPVTWP
ncbi:MAG TPA: VCBS repeat-containing protein, partial [Candidatus Thermoplasmatota archaeon]